MAFHRIISQSWTGAPSISLRNTISVRAQLLSFSCFGDRSIFSAVLGPPHTTRHRFPFCFSIPDSINVRHFFGGGGNIRLCLFYLRW